MQCWPDAGIVAQVGTVARVLQIDIVQKPVQYIGLSDDATLVGRARPRTNWCSNRRATPVQLTTGTITHNNFGVDVFASPVWPDHSVMAGDVRCSFPLFKARFLSAVPDFCPPPTLSPQRRPAEDSEPAGEPGKLPCLALGKQEDDGGNATGLAKGAVSKLNLRMLARDDAPPTEVGARRHKMAQYEKKCSKVLDGLFVGGEFPARDFPTLQANGITHVINCVGSVYPSFHAGKLSYKTLYLEGKSH